MRPLEILIKQQLDRNKSRNLLYENVKQIMEIDPNFLAALEALVASNTIQKPENVSEEIVSFTAQEFVKRLLSINPYLGIELFYVIPCETFYSLS